MLCAAFNCEINYIYAVPQSFFLFLVFQNGVLLQFKAQVYETCLGIFWSLNKASPAKCSFTKCRFGSWDLSCMVSAVNKWINLQVPDTCRAKKMGGGLSPPQAPDTRRLWRLVQPTVSKSINAFISGTKSITQRQRQKKRHRNCHKNTTWMTLHLCRVYMVIKCFTSRCPCCRFRVFVSVVKKRMDRQIGSSPGLGQMNIGSSVLRYVHSNGRSPLPQVEAILQVMHHGISVF